MVIEEQIEVRVPPQAVMDCYRDVAGWPTWDPDTRAASIAGPFASGATGRLKPAKGFAVPMRFTSVGVHHFTVESPAPFCTMRFEHELAPLAGGTRVTHRVTFEGPLARLFGHLVGRRVRTGLPVTMRSLKKHLEKTR